MERNFLFRLVLGLWCLTWTTALNLSPKPYYSFQNPANQKNQSFFGFSIVLKKSSVIVGAPLAEQNSYATGAVYKCGWEAKMNCTTLNVEKTKQSSAQNSGQWLGGSMDGHGGDDDLLVTCAPKRMVQKGIREKGVCYMTLRSKSVIASEHSSVDWYSELGWSVQITDDQNGVVIGDPWKDRYGSVTHVTNLIFGTSTSSNLHSVRTEESWFGYAVTSGHFYGRNQGVQYAASAVHSGTLQSGSVKIFKYPNTYQYQTIVELDEIKSDDKNHFGEYFGYALLAEDFNADGYSDLAVAAPLQSEHQDHENGVVYVYMNKKVKKDVKNMMERKPITLTSSYMGSGRFGMALAKIGDINKDGYNDLAVGAPYEGNGVVYIFLGGQTSQFWTSSQRIEAPSGPGISPASMMFGFVISRGVDIDGNDYNDLAIGAPKSDQVFVYRTYPMLNVFPTIVFDAKSKEPNDKSFTFKGCIQLDLPVKRPRTLVDFKVTFKLDKRIRFTTPPEDNVFSVSTETALCKTFNVAANLNTFHPISVEMQYEMVNKIPTDGSFCDHCFVTISPNVTQNTLPIQTGCKSAICNTDLKIQQFDTVTGELVLGETKFVELRYEIQNAQETSYKTKLLIDGLEEVNFAKIPSECTKDKNVECSIGSRGSLKKNEKKILTLVFDVAGLQSNVLVIVANVTGLGLDINPANNVVQKTLIFKEDTTLRVLQTSVNLTIEAKEKSKNSKFTHIIEVENNGPSRLQEMHVVFFIPFAVKVSKKEIQLFDISEETKSMYSLVELANIPPPLDDESMETISQKNYSEVITCDDSGKFVCKAYQAKFRDTIKVEELRSISLELVPNMKNIYKHFIETKGLMLFLPKVVFVKPYDPNAKALKVMQTWTGTDIKVIQTIKAPIWIYILGLFVGLLVLTIITAIFKKAGFFKRDLQTQMKSEIREHRRSMATTGFLGH